MPVKKGTILFIPHGGGPLPLLGDTAHSELTAFLQAIPEQIPRPEAIIVFSAHWEAPVVTITAGNKPDLIYDYYGFPDESYNISYPAPGAPDLAQQAYELLQLNRIDAKMDGDRGFDHGLFVPLKLMYPEANIPCIQISLLSSLDPEQHIHIGKALQPLLDKNILFLGSGFSFHNMQAFFRHTDKDEGNIEFQAWLDRVMTDNRPSEADRNNELSQWVKAPYARYCHPREEHLLPLHVCYGLAESTARRVFNGNVINKLSSAYLWTD